MDNENLHKEIVAERKELHDDLEKKEKNAQEEIDRILSETQFCTRCNSKVADKLEIAGKCAQKDCKNELCQACWEAEEKRYCAMHSDVPVGKEKYAEEKVFFKPDEQDILTEDTDSAIDSIKKSYIGFLKQRLSTWIPDWTPAGWIENPKTSFSNKDNILEITVSAGSFLFKKPKAKILVFPLYGKKADDIDLALSKIKNNENVYYILVLIGDEVEVSALEFVDSFNRSNASLFLIEPAKHLIYMDEKPITKLFSFWIDSRKAPDNLKAVLKPLVKEKSMGKEMLNVKSASEKFSIPEDQALAFLKSCKFLKHVEDTDTFYFLN